MLNHKQTKQVDFYLGANSPIGFFSYFDQLEKPFTYNKTFLIKAGAGCGKSTLIKNVLNSINNKGDLIENIHCSSDVDSLDGVILDSYKIALLDATRPHFIEPKYHGAFETTVDLCQALDNSSLYKNRDSIIKTSDEISKKHTLCCDFLRAAANLINSNFNIYKQYVNFDKLDAYINRLLAYEIKTGKNLATQPKGQESIRLLSAVTNKGIVTFEKTVSTLANRIYIIEDNVGCISNHMMNSIRERALSQGHDIYTCYCPLSVDSKTRVPQRIEHIIIPKLNLAFVTANKYTRFDSINPTKKINSKRFELKEYKGPNQYIMTFNSKQSAILLDMATEMLKKAKSQHDILESLFNPYVDFNIVNNMTQRVISDVNELSV